MFQQLMFVLSRIGHLLHLKDIFKDKGSPPNHHFYLGDKSYTPFFRDDVGCRSN